MDKQKGVYIAVLNQGNIRPELSYLLTDLTHQGKYKIFMSFPSDKPIEDNRNKIVKKFLEKEDMDYLFMLDGDIIPPLNILDLVDYQKDIIGGLCFAYRQNAIVPLLLEDNKKGGYSIMKAEGTEGLVECDAIGTGCIIIAKHVLKNPKLKHPFKNYYDEDGLRTMGLDLSFCRRAKKLGYKVFCHLNFACSHWTFQDLKLLYRSLTEGDYTEETMREKKIVGEQSESK